LGIARRAVGAVSPSLGFSNVARSCFGSCASSFASVAGSRTMLVGRGVRLGSPMAMSRVNLCGLRAPLQPLQVAHFSSPQKQKKYKLKRSSAAKKRFKVMGTGIITRRRSSTHHKRRYLKSSTLREHKKPMVVRGGFVKKLRRLLLV